MANGVRGGALGLSAALVLALACQRKAPGPSDCLRYAKFVLGVQRDVESLPDRLQDRVNHLTEQCLTTPFDRELLACVEATRAEYSCLSAFRARHAGSGASP